MSKKVKNKGEFKVVITSNEKSLWKCIKFLDVNYMHNDKYHQSYFGNSTTFKDRNTAQKAASFFQRMWNDFTKEQAHYRVMTLFEANKLHLKYLIDITEKELKDFRKQLKELIDENE